MFYSVLSSLAEGVYDLYKHTVAPSLLRLSLFCSITMRKSVLYALAQAVGMAFLLYHTCSGATAGRFV